MKTTIVFAVGLIIGIISSYLLWDKIIASRGGAEMRNFVDTANTILSQSEITGPLVCGKLAISSDRKIDNLKLNLNLNNQLQKYDNGTQRTFFILLYVKGYTFGLADSYKDKNAEFESRQCEEKYPWLLMN